MFDHSSASPPSFLPVVLVASAPCVSFLFLFKYHVSTFEQSWNTLFLIFLECRIIPCIAVAFLFLSTLVFVCAGDNNLDRTIARLRNHTAVENPRARSGSGAFTKALQWKPKVFFPLPTSVIRRVLESVNGEELWPDLGDGVWYIDIGTENKIGTDLGVLLAPYWKLFRDKIREASASRFYALVSS